MSEKACARAVTYLVQPVAGPRGEGLCALGVAASPRLSNQMTPERPLADVCGGICRGSGVKPSTQVSVSQSQIPCKEQGENWISVQTGELAVSAVLGIRPGSPSRGAQMQEPPHSSGEGLGGGTVAQRKQLFILTLFGFWK